MAGSAKHTFALVSAMTRAKCYHPPSGGSEDFFYFDKDLLDLAHIEKNLLWVFVVVWVLGCPTLPWKI